MSRRASLFKKEHPESTRPKVRFSDELVFLDNIKENDMPALNHMLRRASLQVDISGINDAGKNVIFHVTCSKCLHLKVSLKQKNGPSNLISSCYYGTTIHKQNLKGR